MTDYFNFFGLPLVVQDLITEEIVHNSIPEDRIQLALTSKFCNELVQRARPKKIIDQFLIWSYSSLTFFTDSRNYNIRTQQLMEILPNCQIKQLQWEGGSLFSSEDYSEILDMLSEAARFATKFDIIYLHPVHMDEFVGFYVKLKHLKSVTVRNPKLILPYYPSKVKLKFGYYNPAGNVLEDLAKKSQNCPLSFLELECRVSLEQCQQFLQTAKFATGAEICIHVPRVLVCLTHFGQTVFTLDMFPINCMPILISQKYVGNNRRIKLKRSVFLKSDIAFNIFSASNPNKNYFSGMLKKSDDEMLINFETIDRDEIFIVKLVDEIVYSGFRFGYGDKYFVHLIYSAKMLESTFPTANFTTPEERIERINNVLGTNIQLIQAVNFVKTVELFRNTH